MTCNFLENHVLLDALSGRLLVSNCITSTAVQQTVITSGGSGSNVSPLNKEDFQTSQGAVPCGSGTCYTPTNDDYIKFFH